MKFNLLELLKEVGEARSLVVYDLDQLLKTSEPPGSEVRCNYGLRNTDESEVAEPPTAKPRSAHFFNLEPWVFVVNFPALSLEWQWPLLTKGPRVISKRQALWRQDGK